jgi:hypothetical protein
MTPNFKDIVELVGALAWPLVVLIIGFTFRGEIRRLLATLTDKATKLSFFGVEAELAARQVETERLMEPSSAEEKAKALRDLEVAKAIAKKFDAWRREYKHPDGMSDRDSLLLWLGSNHGAPFAVHDYGIVKALAEVLAKMGYDTLPPPTEAKLRKMFPESEIFVSEATGKE